MTTTPSANEPTLSPPPATCYVTTPIYYVNDRPHIGHCYTTLLADTLARAQRLLRGSGADVFFLTGTDEHADKVVTSAAEHNMTPLAWADHNADQFRAAFKAMGFTNNDFIRTTEPRHKERVHAYIRDLQARGDVYLGDYEGWYDASQEEYVTESMAKESPFGPYTSPVTGKPLVKRTEKNYFFRLSAYADRLRAHFDAHPDFIRPEARRNEVLGRFRTGLLDVPISRAVSDDPASAWGILMPDDPSHRIYVWIDALFNYLSVVDTPERKRLWPPTVQLMAKDILWFHAVIWPAMLMALGRELPATLYVHSYWVREGVKMSKSLGNFVTLEVLNAYAQKYSLDAVRWYLLTQGPLGATDADFSHSKFVEVYNADLANGIGNCVSRVSSMIGKYFAGRLPEVRNKVAAHSPLLDAEGNKTIASWDVACAAAFDSLRAGVDGAHAGDTAVAGTALVRIVDMYINDTAPFKLAKAVGSEPGAQEKLGAILYQCAEALRVATLLLAPAMPQKMAEVWRRWDCEPPADVPLEETARFAHAVHALQTGQKLEVGDPLFMRADAADPPPA